MRQQPTAHLSTVRRVKAWEVIQRQLATRKDGTRMAGMKLILAVALATCTMCVSAPYAQVTPEDMEQRLASRMCPPRPQQVRIPSYDDFCGENHVQRLGGVAASACQSKADKVRILIGKYNEFIRQCQKGVSGKKNGASAPTSRSTQQPLVQAADRGSYCSRIRSQCQAQCRSHFTVVSSPNFSGSIGCHPKGGSCAGVEKECLSSSGPYNLQAKLDKWKELGQLMKEVAEQKKAEAKRGSRSESENRRLQSDYDEDDDEYDSAPSSSPFSIFAPALMQSMQRTPTSRPVSRSGSSGIGAACKETAGPDCASRRR